MKTRDEWEEFFIKTFRGSNIITPQIVDCLVSVFDEYQEEPEPAEPKVLTAEECYKARYTSHAFDKNMKFLVYVDGHEDGHQNGRLERDLEYKRVIKLANIIAINSYLSDEMEQDMRFALCNLPPLTKEKK